MLLRMLYNHSDTGKALYGDIVIVLIGITCAIVYAWELYRIPGDDPILPIAIKVYFAMVFPIIFTMPSAITKNLWLSRLGLLAMVHFKAYANIMEWPHPGECTITVMLLGSVTMGVLANISLSLQEKIVRLLVIFIVGSYVSITSPYSVYVKDALPILGGTVLLSTFGLYTYHHYSNKQSFAATSQTGVQASRLVLAALFVNHTVVSFLSRPTGLEQIAGVLKAVVIACIGAVATGLFQKEIQHKEQLEILVRNRTEEISRQNKQLRMVSMALEASETSIAITDQVGCIVWCNTAFEKMCLGVNIDNGKKGEEGKDELLLIGLPLKDVIYKLDPMRKGNRYMLIDALDDSTKATEGELQIKESIFRLEATPFPENSDNDNDKNKNKGKNPNDRFLVVFKDITADRARQLAEKKAHDEGILAKAMGESMVTLTHELRTPLQGIMGVTSLLLQQASWLNADMVENLKLIMASSTLLLNLINNLLDVKKVTAKMMEEFPLTPISASGPIRDAVGFCLPLASISNVNIVTDLPSGNQKSVVVKSNALRLQQVLINLISNAIKYTKRRSEICVRIRTTTLGDAKRMVHGSLSSSQAQTGDDDDGCDNEAELSLPVLVFSVSDYGSGIAPGQAERLFRRFARLDTKPTRTLGSNKVGQPTGTGLGLNLCELFVERMNGQIWATNNSGNNAGATFSFYLPLISNEEAYNNDSSAGGISSQALATRRSRSSTSSGKLGDLSRKTVVDRHVLLVDDTLINRKVFDRMLKKIGISKSVSVESGQKALEELSKNHYDLVITDIQMPGMSGTELSVAINSNTESPPPVVVGLTADTSIDVAQRCAESGMADVLYKPITIAEMKDYFETRIPILKPGTWYANTFNDDSVYGDDATLPSQNNNKNANNRTSPAQ